MSRLQFWETFNKPFNKDGMIASLSVKNQVLKTIRLLSNHTLKRVCLLDNQVYIVLQCRHDAFKVLYNFGWEFFKDVLFCASENEWSNSSFERLECSDELLGVFEFLLHLFNVAC